MTEEYDDTDMRHVLTRVLHRELDKAPKLHGTLAAAAMNVARKRQQRNRLLAVTAAVLVLVIAPVVIFDVFRGATDDVRTDNSANPPGTWRWESYGGIELSVPDTWSYGSSTRAWCAQSYAEPETSEGVVVRPGTTPAIMCQPVHPPIDQRVPWVQFSREGNVGVTAVDKGWDEEIRAFGAVYVSVFTSDEGLRAQIFDTVRIVDHRDSYGCLPTHEAASAPRDYRPTQSEVLKPETTDSVSACRYQIGNDQDASSSLISSSRVLGHDAAGLLGRIMDAEQGSGPNNPSACTEDISYGTELIVLTARNANGHSKEYVIRYHGCDGHGIDDGAVRRMLTADVLDALLVGPHSVVGLEKHVADLLPAGSQ